MRTYIWARLARLVCAAVVCFGAASVAHAQPVLQTTTVTMPDGVKLATDVWTKLGDTGKHPVMLRRTPYGRAFTVDQVNTLVILGFVIVSQDVRGAGDSEGTFLPFFDDEIDGRATIEWAAQQSWSNGRVGTFSSSAEGIVQYMAMANAPAGLRCAHVSVATHDVYEGMFPGGAFRTDLGTNWLTGLAATDVIAQWKSHEVRDAYWDKATLSVQEMENIDHPVFIVGALFDIFAPSEVRAFAELQQHAAASARGDIFFIFGPWTHGGLSVAEQGGLVYPADAVYTNFWPEIVEYMTWCLQDGPRPTFAHVRYYLSEVTDEPALAAAGGATLLVAKGQWRSADTFPPDGVQMQTTYVQADDTLSGDMPVAGTAPVVLSIDPADPAPSVGGGNLTTPAGPSDQTAVDARDDVYVAQTAPVTDSVEIVGTPRITVWATSATTDLDVVARVEVLTAGGKPVAFADGVLRGRFVAGFDAVRPLTPHEPTRFDIPMGPLAVRLTTGQALRVAISSVSSPRYEPNPNVATPLVTAAAPVATTLTLLRDEAHATRIDMPVAAGTLPGAVVLVDAGMPNQADAATAGGDAGTAAGTTAGTDPGAGAGTIALDAAVGGKSGATSSGRGGEGGCGCSIVRTHPPRYASLVAMLLLLACARRARRRRA